MTHRTLFCAGVFTLISLPASGWAQGAARQYAAGTIPAGTPLPVKIDRPLPMKSGQVVRAKTLYPVYAHNLLVLPAGTPVIGSVVALHSDHDRRVRASLGGDFTPFHTPVVRFTRILLPSGESMPLLAAPATDGAPIYRAVAPLPQQGGFVKQEIHNGLTVARADLHVFLGPDKGARLVQFIYSQLPYHPQRIEPDTAWTIETTAALNLPAENLPPLPAAPPARRPRFWEPQLPPPAPAHNDPSSWILRAYLTEPLSSEFSKKGESIRAVVAQPVLGSDGKVEVPQGAILTGTVTRARPSRRFGRGGVLSFNFRQLELPNSPRKQTIETRLTGADTAANVALNSEGQVQSKPKDKLAVPLILAGMAARPLDQDHGDHDGQAGKNGVGGAAGLGLIGTIIGAAGGSPNIAAGIGYWGTARAVYSRWIARGQKIAFAKDTRIVVETTPRRSAPMKPARTY